MSVLGPKSMRFKGIRSIRHYISKVLRDLEDNRIPGDAEQARAMFTGAKLLSEIMMQGQVEERLAAIEKKMTPEAQVEAN